MRTHDGRKLGRGPKRLRARRGEREREIQEGTWIMSKVTSRGHASYIIPLSSPPLPSASSSLLPPFQLLLLLLLLLGPLTLRTDCHPSLLLPASSQSVAGQQEHAMKASVKVREGQRPLVRAKVPVNLCGVPLFSGISVGNERELALHLGSYLEAGPSCRVSYRPNDPHSPLAVLLKTGFGLWGSPHAAPFTIAAEFNLARRENLSFTLRLKPRLGNFSFRKHFCSSTSSSSSQNSTSLVGRQLDVALQEDEVATSERPGEVSQLQIESGATTVYESGYDSGLSPLGLGLGSGLKLKEKGRYFSGDASSTGGLLHVGDGGPEMEAPVVQDSLAGGMEIVKHRPSENGDRAAAADMSEISELDANFALNAQAENRRKGPLQRSGQDQRSWGLSVHSAMPLGRHVIGRVQWGMRLPSNVFGDSGGYDGGSFYGLKLPVLVLDKISIGSVETHRKSQNGRFISETGPLSYGSWMDDPMDEGSQLGLIASMCCSLRNQLHSLHSDSRALKKIIEDMKLDVGQYSNWSGKRIAPKPQNRQTQEESSIRSQLFDELQKKTGSRNSQKDRVGNGSYNGENKGAHGAQSQESLFLGLPSEGVTSDKFSGDPGAKARGLPERSAK